MLHQMRLKTVTQSLRVTGSVTSKSWQMSLAGRQAGSASRSRSSSLKPTQSQKPTCLLCRVGQVGPDHILDFGMGRACSSVLTGLTDDASQCQHAETTSDSVHDRFAEQGTELVPGIMMTHWLPCNVCMPLLRPTMSSATPQLCH